MASYLYTPLLTHSHPFIAYWRVGHCRIFLDYKIGSFSLHSIMFFLFFTKTIFTLTVFLLQLHCSIFHPLPNFLITFSYLAPLYLFLFHVSSPLANSFHRSSNSYTYIRLFQYISARITHFDHIISFHLHFPSIPPFPPFFLSLVHDRVHLLLPQCHSAFHYTFFSLHSTPTPLFG